MLKIIDVSGNMPFQVSVGVRKLADVVYAIVHHTAVPQDDQPTIKRLQAMAKFHISKGWGHIAYHYVIDKEGYCYQCYRLEEIGAHAGEWNYNKESIGICFDGDYTKERLTASQLHTYWELLDYLCTRRPDMPRLISKSIKAHREVRPQPTACPSDTIFNLVEAYRTL